LLRVIEKRETQRQKTLQRELEWIQKSHHGRQQKNEARVKAYGELASEQIDATSETIIQIAPGPRLGEKVLQFTDVSKGFVSGGEPLRLLDDCSFNLPRGAIVGVIGPNGTGKTTLMRMIVGQEPPDAGTIDLGPSVVLSYVDQHRDALDDSRSVFEEITDGADRIELGDVSVNARAYVARFNFRGSLQQKKVGECSGGERNRIHLAKMLRRGGNLLLLDEPTNDLDVATMRVLEQAMLNFSGCALVISHDRFFLDRICTHLLVMEGDGKTRWFEGNFAQYEAAVLAENPERFAHRRAKYQRLTGKLR
jgi:energy-dependent translational throttle protein EttA